MTRVKVCGITSEADLDVAVASGADAIGLIADVAVDTPREIDPALATELAASAPPFVSTVLVTMPQTPERAIDLAARVDPDAVQLHGRIPPGDVAYLRSRVDGDVLLAVDAEEIEVARRYDEVVDGFVVDPVDEDGAGGTGRTHDWTHTREAVETLSSPIVLAGGLTPENVAEAIATVRPFAVDVASGVESTGGVKDETLVRAFVEAARNGVRTVEP